MTNTVLISPHICGSSELWRREVKRPAISKKINDALRQIPVEIGEGFVQHLSGIESLIHAMIVRSGSKSSNLYKEEMNNMEQWADGYVRAARQIGPNPGFDVAIVSGTFYVPRPHLLGDSKIEPRQLICIVRGTSEFIKSLHEVCSVMAVQLS